MTTTATTQKTLPAWLTLSAGAITVKLASSVELNGVQVDRLTLREPTIGDLRAAAKVHKDDKEAQEIHLFASLAECTPADIDRLSVKNYNRVQEGYFRLLADDEDAA